MLCCDVFQIRVSDIEKHFLWCKQHERRWNGWLLSSPPGGSLWIQDCIAMDSTMQTWHLFFPNIIYCIFLTLKIVHIAWIHPTARWSDFPLPFIVAHPQMKSYKFMNSTRIVVDWIMQAPELSVVNCLYTKMEVMSGYTLIVSGVIWPPVHWCSCSCAPQGLLLSFISYTTLKF